MSIKYQYLLNTATGEIKTAGFVDLGGDVPVGYELVVGDLPSGAVFEREQSPSQVAEQLIDELTLAWQDLSIANPTLASTFLALGTDVVQAINNAVRIAGLRSEPLNLDFAKSLISGATTGGVLTETQESALKTSLLSLFPA